MIDRFVGSIRGIRSRRTEFDSYLVNVQKGRGWGGPKYDEARKDFRNIKRGEFQGYIG